MIMGRAETALAKTADDQESFQDLLEILKASERSAELIRQLLAFARKQVANPRILNLNDTIGAMLKMLRRVIGEDIELVWHPGSGLKAVRMDPSQVDQVLVNLLVNARDAISGVGRVIIETGNCTLSEAQGVQAAGLPGGEYVQLAVSDTGSGMDRETLSHLFEPFFTTKEVGKGTGLGLATIFGITKQNQGGITVSSEPGKGSTFTIYLPCTAVEIEEMMPPVEKTGKASRGSETILLVEDEEALLQLGVDTLGDLGYFVLAANTPIEALRLVDEYDGEIQLLITDVVMPEMNGKELAHQILSRQPKVKCLFMSGYTADIIAENGVLEDGVFFIQKPFPLKDLAEQVRQALGKP